MSVMGDLLFYHSRGPDLGDVLRDHIANGLGKAADSVSEHDFATHSDEQLAEQLITRQAFKPLVVEFEKAQPEVKEVTLNVSDYGQTIPVRGFRITKAIPFTGNVELWRLKPNSFDMNPPRGDIQRGKLVIGIELPEAQSARAAEYLDETIKGIHRYLEWQTAQIGQHNASLLDQALPLVQQRRVSLEKRAALLKSLKG